MTTCVNIGDTVIGERLRAEFRKQTRVILTVGSSKHRQQFCCLIGTPAKCVIEKEVRSLQKK